MTTTTESLAPLAHDLAAWIASFPGASLRTLTDLARDAGYHLYDDYKNADNSLTLQLHNLLILGLAHPHPRPRGLEAPTGYNPGVDTLWWGLSPSVAAVLHPGASCDAEGCCLRRATATGSAGPLGESSGEGER